MSIMQEKSIYSVNSGATSLIKHLSIQISYKPKDFGMTFWTTYILLYSYGLLKLMIS